MGVLSGLSFLIALSAVPAVLIFLAIEVWLARFIKFPQIAAALCGGALVSALLMINDAETGFCCREYHATVLTELWLYIPMALVSALFAYPIVAIAAWISRSIVRKRNADSDIHRVFE